MIKIIALILIPLVMLLAANVAYSQESDNTTLIWGFLDPHTKISDILAFGTIFVSIIALFLPCKRKKNLRENEQADKVRTAVAKCLAIIRSWRDTNFTIFNDINSITTASMESAKNSGEFASLFRKKLETLRINICEKLPKESIAKYESIYENDPVVGFFFSRVMERLREEAEPMFDVGLIQGSTIIINRYLEDENHEVNDGALEKLLKENNKLIEDKYKDQINDLALEIINESLEHLFILQNIFKDARKLLLQAEDGAKEFTAKDLKDIIRKQCNNNEYDTSWIKRVVCVPIQSLVASKDNEDILKNRATYLSLILRSIPNKNPDIYLLKPDVEEEYLRSTFKDSNQSSIL